MSNEETITLNPSDRDTFLNVTKMKSIKCKECGREATVLVPKHFSEITEWRCLCGHIRMIGIDTDYAAGYMPRNPW